MTYTILILGGFDSLFNILSFLVGCKASPDITHSFSAVPYRLLMSLIPPHNSGRLPISPTVCINNYCPMCLTIPRKA